MEKGNQEWKEKLSKIYKFPCKIAWVLVKDKDGSVVILSTLVRSKAQVPNVKLSDVSLATFTSVASAILSVKEIKSVDEYLAESTKVNDHWGYALRERGPNT